MMMRYLFAAAIAAGLVNLPFGYAQDAPIAEPPAAGAEDVNGAEALTPRGFLQRAISSGMHEVQSSQLVADKSTSEAVKAHAQKMVQTHTTLNTGLKNLAESKQVPVPEQMMPKHQQKLEKIRGLTGQELDRQYLADQVESHRSGVMLFQRQAEQGPDPDVKAFAATHLPTLRAHLAEAQQLHQQIGGVAQPKPEQPEQQP